MESMSFYTLLGRRIVGSVKLFSDASSAVVLIIETVAFLSERWRVSFLGIWEMAIGAGYMSGRFIRITVAPMSAHMAGAMSPLLLKPGAVYRPVPYALTLEG